MRKDKYEEIMEIPEGVSASLENSVLTIKGPKGENMRNFFDPKVNIELKGSAITMDTTKPSKREIKLVRTFKAHINNLIKGANEGIVYKLKVCSGHFPMNVSLSGDTFSVKNFLGEKVPRILKIKPGVNVKVDGDIITVEGADVERCGNVATEIEQLTRITNRDRRIFQDGIFIIEKKGKKV